MISNLLWALHHGRNIAMFHKRLALQETFLQQLFSLSNNPARRQGGSKGTDEPGPGPRGAHAQVYD